tara:strand:+ start:1986 stop:3266 length:1281 start_codon:yes stop_codon:yes gene_type:complete
VKYLKLVFLSLISLLLNAQNNYYEEDRLRYEDFIYQPGIKTVQFHPAGDDLAMPVIKLFSGEQLLLSFDDLYEDYAEYSYTIIHCNADWTPSNLLQSEYLSNFQDYYLSEYEYSINALIPYTNYRLTIPNSNMRFTKSGNYLLKIYRDNDPNKLVITRRFMVYEDRVTIGAQVRRATQVENKNTHQEIDFTINHTNYTIQNPFQDLNVVLMQDQRWDNPITTLKPQFVQNTQLIYQYDDINTFHGINEFRWFDIKNLQVLTQNVRKIDRDSVYTAYLATDEPRTISRYTVYFDINGHYVVRRLDATNSDFEADYAYVDFILDYPAPLDKGDLYVFGKFTDWKALPEYRLEYDYVRNAYRGRFLLKQGYYNYLYALQKDNGELDIEAIEGSHWETENTYQILVYNRDVGIRYDRLVGFSEFSSEDLY